MTVNDNAEQQVSAEAEAGDQPTTSTPDKGSPAGEQELEQVTDDDDQDDDEQDDDEPAARKARREAARLRKRLRDVETERNGLRDTLTRQQQAIIDRDCDAARLTDRHIAAAQINVEHMLDAETGLIDTGLLEQTISTAVRDFRVGRPPAPNFQQGRGGAGHPGQSPAEAFAEGVRAADVVDWYPRPGDDPECPGWQSEQFPSS